MLLPQPQLLLALNHFNDLFVLAVLAGEGWASIVGEALLQLHAGVAFDRVLAADRVNSCYLFAPLFA